MREEPCCQDTLLACLALSSAEISPRAWEVLEDRLGSVQAILDASDGVLEAVKGISAQTRSRIAGARQKLAEAPALLERLEKMGAFPCLREDPRYPQLLRQIPDPPRLLYVRGELLEQDKFAIAIVGSRSPRPYGLQVARKLSEELARAGLTIVSGGARGIDTAAHGAALQAGGRTIAVAGCGLDYCYPAENRDLYAQIATQGALVTEYPLGAAPEAWRFPKRNRLISGLSRGVIVCDAPEDSGSLITAGCAAEQGRDVFAVPGNVDSGHNRGAHRLLKDGAKLVECAEDVLEEFGLEDRAKDGHAAEAPRIEVSADERRILEMLDLEPLALDAIIERTEMPASDVAGLLTFLEMKRLVKRVAGPAYVRVLG